MTGPSTTPRRSRPRAHARLAAAVLLLATGATGCLDIADPVEPEPGPGRLVANVLLADGERPTMEVEASFEPGVASGGQVRSPADPSLRVLGTTVEPSPDLTREPGRLRYRATDTLDAAELDRAELEIEGPRLSAERPRAVRSLPLIWRAGPDSVRLVEGENLELPLRGAPEATQDGDLQIQWRLDVQGAEGSGVFFSATGNSSIPDALVVPDGALPVSTSGGPLEAVLQAAVLVRSPPDETGYGTFLAVTARLEWRVFGPGE